MALALCRPVKLPLLAPPGPCLALRGFWSTVYDHVKLISLIHQLI